MMTFDASHSLASALVCCGGCNPVSIQIYDFCKLGPEVHDLDFLIMVTRYGLHLGRFSVIFLGIYTYCISRAEVRYA